MELVRDRQKFNLHFLFGQFSVLAVYLIKSNSRPKLKDLEVKKKRKKRLFHKAPLIILYCFCVQKAQQSRITPCLDSKHKGVPVALAVYSIMDTRTHVFTMPQLEHLS